MFLQQAVKGNVAYPQKEGNMLQVCICSVTTDHKFQSELTKLLKSSKKYVSQSSTILWGFCWVADSWNREI